MTSKSGLDGYRDCGAWVSSIIKLQNAFKCVLLGQCGIKLE